MVCRLQSVIQIFSNWMVFVALKKDRTLITWGSDFAGGDSSDVVNQLTDIASVSAALSVFAAVRLDGSVVCLTEFKYCTSISKT